MTPSSARYDLQSSLFGRAVDAKSKKSKTPLHLHLHDDDDREGDAAVEKRGKKRAAVTDRKVGAEDEDSEEGSEEDSGGGSEEDSEEGCEEASASETDSDEDSGSEGEDDEDGKEDGGEEEEEGMDLGQYHALCRRPDQEPLKEPRFGLCFWNDEVPVEVRRQAER